MYQQITLIGHLGGDPTMQLLQDGTPVTSFSVATNRRWRTQDGTTQEETTWFSVSVWERQAELCNQYLTKGKRVLVVGEMKEPSTWTDRDGNVRASLEMRARTVRFLSPRDGAQGLAPDQGEGEEIPF
ncbi:MAG: single-stranded DNA-binding protein [Caldilineaceae bacterium SB0670_bin_27]|uniref:Single-stranded DNA-binding protein n=1 Tax=Caldilineaceae bacterium SB0664_bin_27 TaxID=2605260 RepID=A0A6B0YQU8_9CHLR|nr:single-stranded DNA-binding protein [Caldilineaceae bacterium SB0664_bin_27]MYJ79326.1 single-stranded DNA-binding protein [Caldilineaceae bacterium SB0670_bin_27]